VQIRLPGFTPDSLHKVGTRVRGLFASDASDPQRIERLVDDQYLRDLALAVSGRLGGKVGVAPRLFLKKLVGEVTGSTSSRTSTRAPTTRCWWHRPR
jgi:hypothetical protein